MLMPVVSNNGVARCRGMILGECEHEPGESRGHRFKFHHAFSSRLKEKKVPRITSDPTREAMLSIACSLQDPRLVDSSFWTLESVQSLSEVLNVSATKKKKTQEARHAFCQAGAGAPRAMFETLCILLKPNACGRVFKINTTLRVGKRKYSAYRSEWMPLVCKHIL
jgi:hypothetical protein